MAKGNYKHGMSRTQEYTIWIGMKVRCYNPKAINFHEYGGRGIIVCDEWRDDFSAFLRDVGPRPGRGYSIDRIDNDGNYEPGNVRWVTMRQQSNNTRRNVRLTHDGKTLTFAQWARELGINVNTIKKRYYDCRPIEEVLSREYLITLHANQRQTD